MKRLAALSVSALVISASIATARTARTPDHPSKLSFDSLAWQVPLGTPYRQVLNNGLVTYIAADSALPLVSIRGYVRYGSIADPQGKEGLGYMLSQLMRSGGTTRYPADSLDELLDLLAMDATLSLTESELLFSFSFLSDVLDTALSIMEQMLFHPAFDKSRFSLEQKRTLERIKHRFDDPDPVLSVAHKKAMYSGSVNSRLPSEASVVSITRDDLLKLHSSVFVSRNVIVAASGRFSPGWLRARFEKIFRGGADSAASPVFPDIAYRSPARTMVVSKPVNQAYVEMILPLFKRPHPDYYPVSVLNTIFGGAAFTSRLNASVRSDAGLAYAIHSSAESNYTYPATLYVRFNTKTESTVDAIRIVLDEMENMRTGGATPEELALAKKTLIDGLPSSFRSMDDVVETYAWNEYYGRPQDIFQKYPAEVRAVTLDDVKNMAYKYLAQEKLVYCVVADTAALFAADTSSAFSIRRTTPLTVTNPDSLATLP